MWNTNVYIYITKTLVFTVTMPQIIDNRNADLWGSICCYPVKLWNQHSNCHWFVMPYGTHVAFLYWQWILCVVCQEMPRKNKRCGWCSHSPWRSCGVTVMVMLYIIHLMRSGIVYSIWLCCQIENVDVYFSWPENILEQTADQAVILDPPLLSYFWQNCVEVVP